MAFRTVTITPSIAAGTYALNDVIFNPTELKLPARGARLTSLHLVDNGKALTDDTLTLFFFQKNTHDLGLQNETANISVANFRANQFIGAAMISGTTAGGGRLDNLSIRHGDTFNDPDEPNPQPLGVALNSIETGNAIYVACAMDLVLTLNPTLAEDSLDLVFGFEY